MTCEMCPVAESVIYSERGVDWIVVDNAEIWDLEHAETAWREHLLTDDGAVDEAAIREARAEAEHIRCVGRLTAAACTGGCESDRRFLLVLPDGYSRWVEAGQYLDALDLDGAEFAEVWEVWVEDEEINGHDA